MKQLLCSLLLVGAVAGPASAQQVLRASLPPLLPASPVLPVPARPRPALKMAAAPARPAARATQVVKFVSGIDAILYLDGERRGEALAGKALRVRLASGEYLVKLVGSQDPAAVFEATLYVRVTGAERLYQATPVAPAVQPPAAPPPVATATPVARPPAGGGQATQPPLTGPNALYQAAFNIGANAYNAKDYEKAAAAFKQAATYYPQDTLAVLYCAYAQTARQDFAAARASYQQLLALAASQNRPASADTYQHLLTLADTEKNPADAQRVLRQALALYPTNGNLLLLDVKYALSAGTTGTAALVKVDAALTLNPANANLYAVRGSLYDKQQPELALANYRKAIELDPNNFDGQYNLGVYYYNKAAALYTKASKMSLPMYRLHGKQLEEEGRQYFGASLPYFEKARTLHPDDHYTLVALQHLYQRLGRRPEAEQLRQRLQASSQ